MRDGVAHRYRRQGKSPALKKRWLTVAKIIGDVTKKWQAEARMAESPQAMRNSIFDQDILPALQNW